MKDKIYRRSSGKVVALLLFFIVFLSFKMMAGEIKINNGKTEIKYSPDSYNNLSFRINLSSIQFRDVLTKQGAFTEFFVPGYGNSNSIGDPRLPVYHRLIEVPLHSNIEILFSNISYIEYDLSAQDIAHKIIPAQAPLSKQVTDPNQVPFIYNIQTYQKNEYLGGPLASVTPVGIMRAVNLARLDISPVWYNPVTNKILVFSSFEAKITFRNADISATLDLKKKNGSPCFEQAYHLLPNYQPFPDSLITIGPMTYVIVSDPQFQSALQPFVRWKIKKGFRVIQAYTSNPAVGNTKTSIRNYLMNLYNNPPSGYNPPSFVLLAGDVGQIPAWSFDAHPSDLQYCEYTNDNIPEVYYGRFSAQNLTQLQPYIDKTLEYEQYTMPGGSFLGEAVMVAGADIDHQLTWGNGQINYGTTYYFNSAHNILSHTYLQPMPVTENYSQEIRNNVSNGVAYANYTAHGSEDGWTDPQFVISQIPALQNNHKYCLMVGNCCLTANFSMNCFAEEIVRASHKGALGYIGCSDNSYWDEDYWWGVGFKAVSPNPLFDPEHLGAYDDIFHDQGEPITQWATTMGQMVQCGDMAVEESNSSMKQYYWQLYTLIGDPSLSVYLSVPTQVTASYQNPLIAGVTTLTVTTEPYAYVALSIRDTILLDAQCAGITGIVNLEFDPVYPPDSIDIVVTKQNRKPYSATIPVIPGAGPYVITTSFTIDDSIGGNNNHLADYCEAVKLHVTVKNIGSGTASNVTGTISTTDTNVIITSNTFNFGTIPPGVTLTGHDAFSMTVRNNVPDQHMVPCNILFTDGTSSWNSTLILSLNAPDLFISGITVLDPVPGGNGNGILDPGEVATLKIATINSGHASVNNGIGHLSVLPGSGPFIIAEDPDQFLGALAVNATVYGYYDVTINGLTPIGTMVHLLNLVTAGGDNQYSVQEQYDLEIGQVPQFMMTNDNVTTCNGVFYDSGGPDNTYMDNENFTMVFTPGTAGAKLKAIFTFFEVEEQSNCAYDFLKIYNGPDASSTLIGKYCGSDSPDTVVATTASGSLTFVFHSDFSYNYAGWDANLVCYGGPLTLIANAFPSNVCLGSASQLTAIPSGGSGTYTYQWLPATYLDDPASATPISTPAEDITYTVTVFDGINSVVSQPISVTVKPVPDAPTITENGEILTSSSPTDNQWYLNNAMIPGANGQNYTIVASGTYYSEVTDPVTGCSSDPSNTITFIFTGIGQKTNANYVTIFPNPFMEDVTIEYELAVPSNVKIVLYDAFGKEIRILAENARQKAGKYTLRMTSADLSAGIYYCKIQTSEYSLTKKMILTK
jgi:hypothetical protein